MMASLAWGAKSYSAGVLENQLRYYVLRNGTVAYRGIELPQSARGLTVMAQYLLFICTGLNRHLMVVHVPLTDNSSTTGWE